MSGRGERDAPLAVESLGRHGARRRGMSALAYVVVLLLVLAILPMVIASRAQVHRRMIADTIEPARIAAGELEAYSLEQLLARTSIARPPSARPSRRADVRGLTRQRARLDSSAAALGGIVAARVAFLERTMRRGTGDGRVDSLSTAVALQTIAAAGALQEALDARVAQERTAAIAIERWNVWLPMVLVLLALLGVVAVVVAGREIAALGRAAEESARALAAATEAKAALLRGVTHDLKNPLGAAQGFTELLSAGVLGELTERSRGAVDRVHRLLGDAINIVKDLTELARAESGELIILSAPTRLDAVVAECVSDYQGAARARGIALTASSPGPPDPAAAEVQTDPRRVRQILDNLLTNALKYTPVNGAVRVSVAMESVAGKAYVTVSDTGPGIPDDMRSRVFDEFFRLRSDERDLRPEASGGTGVGLAISRRLARLLGGDLTVAAAPEGGAAFTLSLPVRADRRAKAS